MNKRVRDEVTIIRKDLLLEVRDARLDAAFWKNRADSLYMTASLKDDGVVSKEIAFGIGIVTALVTAAAWGWISE